ncbi:hypothetical protein [Rhodococcus artemisiae]|uniref:Uncharacterized protein n=1 Tax=Rhodococcus artemisiae TaxID=714159 RepID=A0ABU7LEM5_9NOCA|nr:hypothetical protein [Rhodococcus artemisiae]MEE2060001.1 hypothetical protein [Rhodococcus artemisiae]
MAHPVIPPTHRSCSNAVRSHSGRPRADNARINMVCRSQDRADSLVIPFGRDGEGNTVAWTVAAGRNLLVHQRDTENFPNLPLTLMATGVLSRRTHELFVADPHHRHHWLAGYRDAGDGVSSWAATPDEIGRMLAELDSVGAEPRRLLLLAGLSTTIAKLDLPDRERLTRLVTTARTRNLTVVATSSDHGARWFPDGLIAAFDDVLVRESGCSTVYRNPLGRDE